MKKTLLSILFSVFLISLQAQSDLFNLENSRKFGEYLLQSGQYQLAVKEFERVVFLDSIHEPSTINLLRSYRLAGNADDGLSRAAVLFPQPALISRNQAIEYSKLLLTTRNWDRANQFWSTQINLNGSDKVLFKTTENIFTDHFKEAKISIAEIKDTSSVIVESYRSLIDRAIDSPRKSPFLAGALSTAVPGLGKVYTGDWKDAIVSLIFTGGMAFQAVRNFNKHGINNYRPWVYTTIGAGFYLGNIFGSVKSAKDRNRKRINTIQHEASDLFNAYY